MPNSEAGITQRYHETEQRQITRRFETEQAGAGTADTPVLPGQLIAGQYRLLAGPIGHQGGEAQVYLCQDEPYGRRVAFKHYHYQARPKAAVIQRLEGLAHPHIVRMLGHGDWLGRYFEVMEYCEGGVFADFMPLAEAALRRHLPGLLQGLAFCHDQGIVHRDLKPNNLFFRRPQQREPLIGDFGISSYLDTGDSRARLTQTAANLTLDYSAPELLDHDEVSPATDYYALGITLMHLVNGRSPFQGLPTHSVLVAHLRGRLDYPPHVSADLLTLLKGLTVCEPRTRWGYDEVLSWLQGEPVELPPMAAAEPAASAPTAAAAPATGLPDYPAATTPAALAEALTEFDAAAAFSAGRIRAWLEDKLDEASLERIAAWESDYADHPSIALVRLRYLLKPQAEFRVAGQPVDSLHTLAVMLAKQDSRKLAEALHKALWSQEIEAWIEARQPAAERSSELIERIRALRQRHQYGKSARVALLALQYILDPSVPFYATPELRLQSPQDLARAFQQDRQAIAPVIYELIDSQRLAEWLQAIGHPEWETLTAFLQTIRIHFLDRPMLAAFCYAWRLLPALPFPVAGKPIREPRALARLIDSNAHNRRVGSKLLERGWLGAWLYSTQRIPSLQAFEQALEAGQGDPQARLEIALKLLDPDLPAPKLEVAPPAINLGVVYSGQADHLFLKITNASRGYLSGVLRLQDPWGGIALDKYTFAGNETAVCLTAKAIGLTTGLYHNAVLIRSTGGDVEIPVQFVVGEAIRAKASWLDNLLERFSNRNE